MAFCHRISQSKLKLLSHQLKRCYFQVPFASLSDYISRSSSSPVLKYPFGAAHKKPIDFCNNVRFYAAPYLAKAKKEEKAIDGPRMNEQIQAKFVRLVTDKGHNVVSIREALEQAKKLDLDLVEVQRKVDPPVCKIMDYHREKYIKQVKEKDRAKSKKELTIRKGDCKEVRFSGKTEHKDLKMKADAVKRLMERGYRVKCVALASRKKGSSKVLPKKVSSDEDSKDGFGDEEDTFERRGGEDEDLGALLSQLTTMIEDVSIVESGPRVETKQAYVIVRHVKFGPSKKGGAKKLKDVQTAQPTAGRSGIESPDMLEYGSETEEGISSDEEDLPDDDDDADEKTRWSVTDSTNDFEEVFNFNDSGSVPSINPKEKMKVEPRAMSSHSRLNISDFSRPRPAHDFKREDGPPSSPPKTSFGAENRYGRNQARDQFPPTSEPNRGLDKRDSMRYESAMSNQRRQPPSESNGSPPIRDRMQVGTDSSSAIKNIKLPHNDTRKQEPPPPGPSSPPPASSYGIFSSPKASPPSKQGVATVGNQERGGGPHKTARNPNRGRFGTNPNIPCSNTNGGHDRGGQGGWGVFSKDSRNPDSR